MTIGMIHHSITPLGIANVIIDNPSKKNAMSFDMWKQLLDVVGQLSENQAIRVIVIQGYGVEAFCSGADISQFSEVRTESNSARFDELTRLTTQQISQSAKPTIAAIRGYCLGGGLNLALSCDIRISASDAKFSLPPARLGIAYPGYALTNLVNVVGEQAAKYLLFSARRISASNALQIGLVTSVIDVDSFAAEVEGLACDIAVNSPLSIKAAKVGLGLLGGSNDRLDDPKFVGLVEKCYTSEDYKEGTAAFQEKREPNFKGR